MQRIKKNKEFISREVLKGPYSFDGSKINEILLSEQ